MAELNLNSLILNKTNQVKSSRVNKTYSKSSKSLKSKYFTKKIKTDKTSELKHDVPNEYKESIYYNTTNFTKVSKNIMKSIL